MTPDGPPRLCAPTLLRMMDGRLVIAGICATVAVGCAAHDPEPATTSVRLAIKTLAGFEQVDAMSLLVADGAEDAVCDPTTGLVAGALIEPSRAQVFELGTELSDGSPCPEGGLFCSDSIELPMAKTPKVFQAVGTSGGETYAVGCTTQAVDSNPLYLRLKLTRYFEPAVCGDGTLQVGEQCEGASGVPADDDPVCDSKCRAKEVLLSDDNVGGANLKVINQPPRSKQHVSVAWSKTSDGANPFHAVFQDTNFGTTGGTGPEINYRQMSSSFTPIRMPALLQHQIRLPKANSTTPGFDVRAWTQGKPVVVALTNGSFAVAYEDNQTSAPGVSNISFATFSANLQDIREGETINTEGRDRCFMPAIAAGPASTALIVWADTAAKRVRGRYLNGIKLMPDTDKLLYESAATQPSAAGSAQGWKIALQRTSEDAGDIVLLSASATLDSIDAPKVVNTDTQGLQEQPAVAVAATGETAVVWRSGNAIMMQRFDRKGSPIKGDQSEPINNVPGSSPGQTPAITASSLNGGFFVVVWQGDGGQVYGRYVSLTGGFMVNPVTGLDGAFPLGHPDIAGQRARPAVTVGGDGYVVFAWQDDSTEHPGIYARRFPLPQ